MSMMNILVVDDKQAVLSQLDNLLSPLGHTVVMANNGLDGYEKVQKEVFDLIIVDHLMPLMNGIQMLKNIKQHIENVPPIFFMTTQGKDNSVDLIEQSFCDMVLDKPLDETHLLSLISQLNKQNTHARYL
tara:strand:- start:238 stop:627 length:390 start_codon:yes stop_codon:yes gene_type:complete